ncbi:G5 domain-containing protein [Actinomyces faecalis]|uniref:aggregation-promoting factor C-terminal-like domain-containing protein n=1 Tax=Actinomyces faecalis TaxID=2722820 RepID=UPI001554D15D|nr:G5 domain-containing protein [Actinomyces faecalis]
MGRHSQSSSVTTTLVGLGALAQRSLTPGSRDNGRRRAEGPVRTSMTPVVMRAGGTAATLALAVCGGAYAAVSVSGTDVRPLGETQTQMRAIGEVSEGTTAQADSLRVPGAQASVSTVTEDVEQPYETVEERTDTLLEGESQVKTAGVNGLVRTTYQVTTEDGTETLREVLSQVTVTEKVDEVVLVGTGTAATTAGLAAAGTDAASAQAIARSMLSSYGWGDEQFSCLVNLWNRESNWNYRAQNPSSGAYGIPQSLPGSKMASAGSDWSTNPATQITWGLGYISGRYGNPCGAWAHSQSVGWY